MGGGSRERRTSEGRGSATRCRGLSKRVLSFLHAGLLMISLNQRIPAPPDATLSHDPRRKQRKFKSLHQVLHELVSKREGMVRSPEDHCPNQEEAPMM